MAHAGPDASRRLGTRQRWGPIRGSGRSGRPAGRRNRSRSAIAFRAGHTITAGCTEAYLFLMASRPGDQRKCLRARFARRNKTFEANFQFSFLRNSQCGEARRLATEGQPRSIPLKRIHAARADGDTFPSSAGGCSSPRAADPLRRRVVENACAPLTPHIGFSESRRGLLRPCYIAAARNGRARVAGNQRKTFAPPLQSGDPANWYKRID